MTKDRDTNFREHSIFLSEIAKSILDGKDNILTIPGVREIISLYLLIPYATHNQLDAGMPGYFGQTVPGVSVKQCHFERYCNDT